MRQGTNNRGYTIVEVMVFLAVSGFMFIMAASFINGKQASAEFKQGASDFNSQVRSIINDVSNGFYPSTNNFVCHANAAHEPDFYPTDSTNTGEQGTNQGCTFIGKVIQFSPQDASEASYYTYVVAGLQFTGGGNSGVPPAKFSDAKPTVVIKDNPPVDLTDKKALGFGLRFTKACLWVAANNKCGEKINGVGFFGGFGGFDPSTNTLLSGSQTTQVVPFKGNLDKNENAFLSEVKNGLDDNAAVSSPDALICMDNGSGRFASLKIGGDNGQRLTTRLTFASDAASLGCD